MLYVEILSNVPSHPNILHPDKPDHLGSLRDGPGGAGVADPEVARDVHGEGLLCCRHLLIWSVVMCFVRVTVYWLIIPHQGAQKEPWTMSSAMVTHHVLFTLPVTTIVDARLVLSCKCVHLQWKFQLTLENFQLFVSKSMKHVFTSYMSTNMSSSVFTRNSAWLQNSATQRLPMMAL